MDQPRMKIAVVSVISPPIANEWFNLHPNKLELVQSVDEADYIIFETNGDPIHLIDHINSTFPKKKLVFILSGDQSNHIDNECIWFTNAVKASGLAKNQTQIFVTNPAIFKFYESLKNISQNVKTKTQTKNYVFDIYFKGTIWDGMRTDMYDEFVSKPKCKIVKNNNYWKWRCESNIKPSQLELENTAYESYKEICKSKLCLCPKGNGNSSMRIIEAIACGSIPILINDFSSPFGNSWGDSIGLSFDTNKHSWEYIYNECNNLINDKDRYETMKNSGKEYFENVIYGDSKLNGFKMYNNIDTVAFGFSKVIIDKLYDIFISSK